MLFDRITKLRKAEQKKLGKRNTKNIPKELKQTEKNKGGTKTRRDKSICSQSEA